METKVRVMDRWDVSDPTGVSLYDRLGLRNAALRLVSCKPEDPSNQLRAKNIDPNRMTGQKGCKVRCKVTKTQRRFSL